MKPKNKISIRFVIAGVAAVALSVAACPRAKANLGDTYAQSCRLYGGRGAVYKGAIVWHNRYGSIMEVFNKNRCVCVLYSPPQGQFYAEGAIWQSLEINGGTDQWQRNADDPQGNCEFQTLDGAIYAKWWHSGTIGLRIAYASYLKSHDLFRNYSADNEERAPADEADGTGM